MNHVETTPEATRYQAFISYSHADAGFASWLHRKLEASRLPEGGRLSPIFIDRAELAAGPDLTAQVRAALAGSAALIVVASPSARASQWVNREIALFRQLHPDRPVLCALIAGEPDEAFPEALLGSSDNRLEPLAADFRKGADGKRLGLVKIVAGLSGEPLDRLVRREAQNRQRRVMAITAGLAMLSLVLAGLLIWALRQRADAQRQRAEAEGMVEFMLTDLRDKLKGVGRLDVMDAVNERAMAHYAGMDPAALPPDEALRRAKLLQTMGSDDIERAGPGENKLAIRKRAEHEFTEAWRITNTLLRQAPQDQDRIFAHSQSEFYLGMLAFTPADPKTKPDFAGARRHVQSYFTLASRLVALAPAQVKWKRELGFAQGMQCSIGLQSGENPAEALSACHAASATMESIYRLDPTALQPGIELANRLGWEADTALAAGQQDQAIALRQRQIAICGALVQRYPNDARALKAEMLAQLGAGKLFLTAARSDEASRAARRALDLVSRLSQIDPENADWAARREQILKLMGNNRKA